MHDYATTKKKFFYKKKSKINFSPFLQLFARFYMISSIYFFWNHLLSIFLDNKRNIQNVHLITKVVFHPYTFEYKRIHLSILKKN